MNVNTDVNMNPNESESSSTSHTDVNGVQKESKLELFGFDSLVNILGLQSMTGEQPRAPSSPREGEDVSIMLERPKLLHYIERVKLLLRFQFLIIILICSYDYIICINLGLV
ncbi:Cation-chloride cotransporter 1 [Bienertia sinuspersici]